MKFSASLIVGFGLAASVIAHPFEERDEPAQAVHLTFHGGPAQYQMTLLADGVVHPTSEFDVDNRRSQ
jgi:hypothetical protein